MQKKVQKQKIIVIGAGLSGLSAANQLLNKLPQSEVIVLQALDRVGGKSYTTQICGFQFDLGAQFVGPSQHFVIDLASKAKAQFVPQSYKGKKLMILNGKKSIYNSNIPNNVNILSLLQMQWCIWKVNRMAGKISLSNPSDCQMGAYWDSMTLKTWIENNIWDMKVRLLFQVAVRTLLGSQLSQISLLYFLWFVAQNKSFDNLINIENGLQQKKIIGGTQHLSIYLQKKIQEKGGKIYFNQYVRKISQIKNQVTVFTENNQYTSNYLIYASSPATMQKINFQPSLSVQRKFHTQKSYMGVLIKVVILYQKQYWKEKGYSGQIISDCSDCPIISGFDDTKQKQNGEKQPALIIFVGGGVYRYWKQHPQFQNVLVKKLSNYFQSPEMEKPKAIKWYPFDDYPSLAGGPLSILSVGSLSQISNLRKPEGKIHFAGTQLATISAGYMDGAIQSGLRAANEVIQDQIQSSLKQKQVKVKESNNKMWYKNLIRTKSRFFQWW